SSKTYVKIGGILSQCGYSDGAYQIVLGIGINATNPRPTTSLSDLLPAHASSSPSSTLRLETLLARILTRLESLYAQFRREGFTEALERRYYRHWLHAGQLVSLEAEGGLRARVLGITRDWGMLRVEEVDREGRRTGRLWTLQSDENSFDFWKGLLPCVLKDMAKHPQHLDTTSAQSNGIPRRNVYIPQLSTAKLPLSHSENGQIP
ncbi:hypothetical protein E4U54_005647, partial [Claviceps lovelessii]